MEIKKIAVLGAGLMGHGITQVAATAGFEVTMRDIEDRFLSSGMEKIKWSLGKFAQKGRISEEDAKKAVERIKTTVSLKEATKDVDFVIEAVPEKLKLKQQVFKEIDGYTPSHAILATNTSALPITEIAAATNRPEKVVGMHFFSPPQMMRLCEVIRGDKTSDETLNITIELGKKFGKEVIICKKDIPGFIANRITAPGANLVCWMVYNGEYTVEEVDAAAIHKAGMPMGSFGLMDFTGIDVGGSVSKFMEERWPGYKMCPLIKEKLEKRGLTATLLALREVTPSALMQFPGLDAFINTACPRLSLDDASAFLKPLLSLNEALVMLGELKWEKLLRRGWFGNST